MLSSFVGRVIRSSRGSARLPPAWAARTLTSNGDDKNSNPSSQQIDTCKSVYITNIDSDSSNAPLLIGLMDYFLRHIPSIGFFQPIGSPHTPTGSHSAAQSHADLLHAAFPLKGSPESSVGVTQQEAVEDLMEDVYQAYEKYRAPYDVVVMEGATQQMIGSNFMEVNAEIAANLNAPVVMVARGDGAETATQLHDRAKIGAQVFQLAKADVLGLVVNKAPAKDRSLIASQLARRLAGGPLSFLGALPYDNILASIRLDQIHAALGAKLVYGTLESLDREYNHVYVASAVLEQILAYLEEGGDEYYEGTHKHPLVICSRTRADVVIALLAAHLSGVGPPVAGVLTTGKADYGLHSSKIVERLSQYNQDALLPVLHIDAPTYTVTNAVAKLKDRMLPSSSEKILQSKLLFDRYIDANTLVERLDAQQEATIVTPKMFMHGLTKRCKAEPQHIVLPESLDKRVLRAAEDVTRRGIARVTLLGDPDKVAAQAKLLNADISGCEVVDHMNSPAFDRYVAAVCEARKSKNWTPEQARDVLSDVNYFATAAVMCGDADGMVSGATHTTANTIRPALQLLRTHSKQLISSVFFMCLPDKILVYGDCAVNVSPSPEELAHIAVTSADTAQAFGISPARVALLSYSTLGSGAGPEVEKVTEAARLAKDMRPELFVEGPIQYDAAVDRAVAEVKIKGHSDVAGRANVCIFPDLNTGNNTYKAVQQSTGAIAIGPILQGLTRPVNDLSRGCTVADIVNTIECTSIQAMQAKENRA